MYITKIINSISFIFISITIINISNSATINLHFSNNLQNKCDDQKDNTKYKYTINYKKNDENRIQVKFDDFDKTNTKITDNIKEKFDGDFMLTGIKSYPISTNGDYTLGSEKIFNIKKEFGIPVNASNLLLILNGVSISSDIENISIINNSKIFKPILLISYNELYLHNNLTIKCSKIPFVKLYPHNVEEYYEIFEDYIDTCKIKSIEALNRYTVFHFNVPIKLDGRLYDIGEKVVIKGKKTIPYDDVIWN